MEAARAPPGAAGAPHVAVCGYYITVARAGRENLDKFKKQRRRKKRGAAGAVPPFLAGYMGVLRKVAGETPTLSVNDAMKLTSLW